MSVELSRQVIFEFLMDRPDIKPIHKVVLMVVVHNSNWKTGHIQLCRTAIKNKVGCSLNTLDKTLKLFESNKVLNVHREFCEVKKYFKPNKYSISIIGLSVLLGVSPGEITHIKGKRTPKKTSKKKSSKGVKVIGGVTQNLSKGVTQNLSKGVTQKMGEGSLRKGCTLTQKMGEGSRKNEDIIPVYEPVSLPVNKPVIDNANTNKTQNRKPNFGFPRVTYDPIEEGKKKAEMARARATTIKRERR